MNIFKEIEKKSNNNLAVKSIFIKSKSFGREKNIVKGIEFNHNPNLNEILEGMRWSGFQATNLGKAIEQIREMIQWRPSMEQIEVWCDKDPRLTIEICLRFRTTIFLGLTSNMISSGNREIIRYLCEHNMIDCIVTTGGAIEEDLMKCFTPHYHGSFFLNGNKLRLKGYNRIGNLLVPNNTYCIFENWFKPILKKMKKEQEEFNIIWTPSKMIRRLGKEINNKKSVWYWCFKNNIPVFCPGITDGAIGDVIYFGSYDNDDFILDVSRDVREINDIAMKAKRTGMIILGGGLIKHHICNANLMRNGADYSIFVNTGQEFDGSDSGARPDEAISWGKIRLEAKPVKVYAEATIVLPLLISGSFVKYKKEAKKEIRNLLIGHEECTFEMTHPNIFTRSY